MSASTRRRLGYDAIVLFLDELILWLASHAADLRSSTVRVRKLAKLVEARPPTGPSPSSASSPGSETCASWWATISLARSSWVRRRPQAGGKRVSTKSRWKTATCRRLPSKRLLSPKSDAARARTGQTPFEQTATVREEVMNTLLTSTGDREMFRQVYPFSPALVQTLVAVSSVLQRERTALKVMLQLLVDQRDTLKARRHRAGGRPLRRHCPRRRAFSQAMRIHFDNAKKLYHHKLLPMLERSTASRAGCHRGHGGSRARATRFRTDDRLLKTLILSALVPEVEALAGAYRQPSGRLNHGTIRSPIPGQEGQIVLNKCRNWAAQVGEIKISDEGANPVISLHIVGVDTEGILANAQNFDSYGNRIQKARSLLFEQIGLDTEDRGLLPPRYELSLAGDLAHV